MTQPIQQPKSPLAYRDYRLYLISRFAAVLAQNMVIVVIGWQAYEVSRSHYGMSINAASFQLGLIGLAQFLPLFLLTPFVGLVADRFDRRRIGQLSLGLDSCIALLFAVATAHDAITLPLLYIGSVLHGIVRAFMAPAMSSLGPNLVPAEVLPRAIATGSIAWQTGSISGPMLGGLIFAISAPLPYALAAAFILIAVVTLQIMKPVPQSRAGHKDSPFAMIADGFNYVKHHKLLLGCISLDLFAVLLGGATAMLPAYARDILHVGASGLGVLRAAPAVGAALTAFLLAWRPIKYDVGTKMLIAVGVFGLATAIFGLSHNIYLSFTALFILGVSDMVSVFIRTSLIQLHTPDAMRGRVGAISSLFISASNELGEAESGLLAALVGPVIAVVGGGIGAIAITLLWARVFPQLREAKTFATPKLESIQ